ncbi:MAG: C-GCAxxG-C-C family protein [Methanoregulaceae archaeon]|nr:C-GCAxxG-C-C family protein [Methanoregulaceae archaeon]
MKKSDEAVASFLSGFTCSSAVFSTFSEELGLDSETAKKIACGFGAGVSKTGNICGAISGAILVIGLKYGKTHIGDNEATDKTRALVRECIREFIHRNGSVSCTELLGYNLNIPDEYQQASKEGLFKTSCPEYVRDATDIIERII